MTQCLYICFFASILYVITSFACASIISIQGEQFLHPSGLLFSPTIIETIFELSCDYLWFLFKNGGT